MSNFLKVDNKGLEDLQERLEDLDIDDIQIACLERLAKRVLSELIKRTPRNTGKLQNAWRTENARFHIKRVADGYEITLTNSTEYASYVDLGHYSYNQFNVGGTPYIVKHRTVPYYEGNSSARYVFGRHIIKRTENFFNGGEAEDIVTKELEAWLKPLIEGS